MNTFKYTQYLLAFIHVYVCIYREYANQLTRTTNPSADSIYQDVYVVPEPGDIPYIPWSTASIHTSQPFADVINGIVARAVRLNTYHRRGINKEINCLALGYRPKSFKSEAEMKSFNDIECHYINTLHVYFFTPEWQAFYKHYGMIIY